MPRTRSVPDATIFAAILQLLTEGGEKAVSFATVAAATGLAPPTLVQRYVSRDRMVRAARLAAWDELDQRTADAIAASQDKGPQGLLKALGSIDTLSLPTDLRDPDLRLRALAWKSVVESSLSLRLGSGQKARETAAMLFALWQGQALWSAGAEDGAFKLKDAIKRLT